MICSKNHDPAPVVLYARSPVPTEHLFVGELFRVPEPSFQDTVATLPDLSTAHRSDDRVHARLSFFTVSASEHAFHLLKKAHPEWKVGYTQPVLGRRRTVERKALPRPALRLRESVLSDEGCRREGLPLGLRVELEFLTPNTERSLVEYVQSQTWQTKLKRRVQHYGAVFDYETLRPNFVSGDLARNKIPKELLQDVFKRPGEFDQLTVNEYHPGIGIAPHVETHSCFEEGFCSITLAGGIVMDLRRPRAEKEEVISLWLPPRSRISFFGRSRYEWKHGIASRTTDVVEGEVLRRHYRISLTYRKLKQRAECGCSFPGLCDFQNPSSLQLPNRISMAPRRGAPEDDSRGDHGNN